jgi:hypothetical protein
MNGRFAPLQQGVSSVEQPKLETVVRNLDGRVARIEQILPTLVTKEDLKAALAPLPTRDKMHEAIRSAIQKAVEPLPTRDEMHEAIEKTIQKAVDPLATKVEVRDEGQRTRRHFDVVAESLRGDIQLIAEGQVALQLRFEELRTELKSDIGGLDRRLMRLEASR